MKIKRKGYILFIYWSGEGAYFEIDYEFCESKKRLMERYDSNIDDKWDMSGRNKIHYFYLDIAKNKYIALPKWKDDFVPAMEYDQSETKVMSTKTF